MQKTRRDTAESNACGIDFEEMAFLGFAWP
jgi:hypothetical protein